VVEKFRLRYIQYIVTAEGISQIRQEIPSVLLSGEIWRTSPEF